jgi:uncharacterized protein YybS (DUF2232 family)
MKKSSTITEGALFSGIYLLLLLMTIYLPVIGIVSIFLLPIPFIIYTFKHGFQSSLLMLVVTSLLTIVLTTIFSLPITLMSAMGGIAIGVCLHRKRSVYETWAVGSVAFAIGFVLVLLLGQYLFEMNFMEEMNELINDSIMTTKEMMNQIGSYDDQTFEMFEEQMNQLTYLIPTMIGFVGVIYSFLALWIGLKVINRIEQKTLSFPPFREFNLPKALIWYYFLSIILMWIEPEQGSTINQVATNISMLTGFLLVLQGLAFIAYYVHEKQKSKGLLITAIILIVLLPFIFMYPVRILGIIDIGFNLRDRMNASRK